MKSKLSNHKSEIGFTLVELLVVVAIIALLLSLLSPALDRAVYQAQLAVCGAQQKGTASGIQTYALSYSRHYPDRPFFEIGQVELPKVSGPSAWNAVDQWDDRGKFKSVMSLRMLIDPLADRSVDLERSKPESHTFASFCMYFGFRWGSNGNWQPGMLKLGDRWGWAGRQYRLMISDEDGVANSGQVRTLGSHPDADGLRALVMTQDEAFLTYSATGTQWFANGLYKRGPVETNVTYDDGSVSRLRAVRWDESNEDRRIASIPRFSNGTGWAAPPGAGEWDNIPSR